MAIQKDTEFIGRVENLIYYKWMDLYCVRTAPKQMRQSEGTKQAARNFGLAYSRSKILRGLARDLIANPRDRAMQLRLKNALLETLKVDSTSSTDPPVQPLMGFHFNHALPIGECLKFHIEITRPSNDIIKINTSAFNPVLDINSPAGTSRIQLEFVALGFSFGHEAAFRSSPEILNIPFTDGIQSAKSLEIKARTDKHSILLVIAAVSYWKDDELITKGRFNPVEVVQVFEQY